MEIGYMKPSAETSGASDSKEMMLNMCGRCSSSCSRTPSWQPLGRLKAEISHSKRTADEMLWMGRRYGTYVKYGIICL